MTRADWLSFDLAAVLPPEHILPPSPSSTALPAPYQLLCAQIHPSRSKSQQATAQLFPGVSGKAESWHISWNREGRGLWCHLSSDTEDMPAMPGWEAVLLCLPHAGHLSISREFWPGPPKPPHSVLRIPTSEPQFGAASLVITLGIMTTHGPA